LNFKSGKIELSHKRAERFYLRLSLGTLLVLILVIVIFWGGHDLYVHWQERRLTQQALDALQGDDNNTASVAARAALELEPSSAPAARVMAELAEKAGNRAALNWRHRVVDLLPNSVEDKLAWARCALQFNDVSTAEGALSLVQGTGRQIAEYHAVAALLAQAHGQEDQAESEWTQTLQLAPGEKNYHLQLGILQLRGNKGNHHASGEAMLTALRHDTKLRAPATRALINDGILRHESAQRLLQLIRELQGYPEATFHDRISYVQALHALHRSEFAGKLAELQNDALTDTAKLGDLLAWMAHNNLSLLAVDWAKAVPAEVLGKRPVPMALADCYVALSDWNGLYEWCKKGTWPGIDFLRHAYLAFALRERSDDLGSEAEWNMAVQGAASDGKALYALERNSAKWGWRKEAENLLWTLSKDPQTQISALAALNQYYSNKGDSKNLYRVVSRMCDVRPDDEQARNNFAQLSLLLNLNADYAGGVAERLYKTSPNNAVFASTYSFSLYQKGRYRQAANIMSQLKPEDLQKPQIAAYFGIFLAAAGDPRAPEFLDLGSQAQLLPEEKMLLEKARVHFEAR